MANIKKDFASPNGPILLLSAKGLTTAGIAEANGVKDFSGNGNHGQAYGGVTVVNDVDLGECFSFDGTDDWLELADNLLLNNTEISINIAVKFTANNTARDYILIYGQFNQILIQTYNGNSNKLLFYSRGYSGDSLNEISFDYSLNTPYYISFNIDFKSGHSYVFINGVFIGETQNQTTNSYIYNTPNFRIGREHSGMSNGNYFFTGKIGDIRIYPRVLSAAEIKYLYNGFQPNLIMGQTIPSGAILDLSARGLTTAGIAQANGVVDRSGNGNHGQAYNGVAIVNDDEMGSCFSFDGGNDVIAIGSNNLSSYFNDMEEMSLSLLLRVNAVNTSSQYLVSFKTQVSASNQSWICLWIDASTRRISFSGRWKESDWGNPWTGNEYFLTADLGTVYHTTVVCDFKNGVFKAYVNGVLVQTTDNLRTGNLRALSDGNNVFFGALNDTPQYGLNCSLADIRIYPRALTASEVQQLADASLKKVRDINMGSNLIKHIYYGSNLIYANTALYSSRPPVGTVEQIAPANTATSATYAVANAVYMRYGTLKKLVVGDYGTTYIKIYDLDGTRSSGTYTDFDYSTSNIDIAMAIAEDDEGCIYITGANTGYIVKLQVCSRVVNGQTNYYLEKLASMRLGSLVAANQVTYCKARDAIIVIGWSSGGSRSYCFQISKDFSSVINIANWSMPSMGGCFTLDGKRLFLSLYSSNNRFGYIDFSSASDTATKTSYTYADTPTGYSPNINSGNNDARYATAGIDGYMYFQMLNGSVLKYTTDGQYVAKIGDTGSVPTSGSYSTPRHDGVCTYDEYENALVYPKADGTICRMYL